MSDTSARTVRLAVSRPRVFNGPDTTPASPADAAGLIDNLNRAFEAFKAKNDERIDALAKGRGDVITAEHVDRINVEVAELSRTVQAMSMQAAARFGDTGGQAKPDAEAAHRVAFLNWVKAKGNSSATAVLEAASSAAGAFQNAASTENDPAGGFLVPTMMETQINRIQGLASPMRLIANVVSTTAPVNEKLHDLGGASSGWVGEKETRTETDTPTLSKLAFPTFEIYAMPAATNVMLDDASTSIEAWLSSAVGISFAEKEGDAWVRGNGVVKPRGFLAYTPVANASWAWGKVGFIKTGVAAALTDTTHNGYDALIDMMYGLKSRYRSNAQFVMNDLTAAEFRKIKDGNGNYMWQPPVQAGDPSTMLGKSVVTDDNMDDIGAGKFPVAFADWKAFYRIADYRGIRVIVDQVTNKPYTLYYTTKRVGGGIEDFQAGLLLKVSA